MSRPFLDLCKAYVAELGIGGGSGPASVTGQSGEMANVVQWIADADIYVQNLWLDWKFLWTAGPDGQVINPGMSVISSITDMHTEIEDGMVLHADSVRAYRPKWMPYPDFRTRFKTRPKGNSSTPGYWTVRPDGIIELSTNVTEAVAWSLEYHKTPTRMTSNVSVSPIPTAFDRIILARAAVFYGTREDAPEIDAGFVAEYADTLEKLESWGLPGQRNSRRSQNRGLPEPDFLGRGGFE